MDTTGVDVSPLPGCHRVASEGLGLGIPGCMSPWWSLESWEGGTTPNGYPP